MGGDAGTKRWRAEREWKEPGQTIHITTDDQFRTVVVFDGRGSMHGTKALMDLVESLRDELGHHIRISVLVDLRRLEGAPLRAQFVLGKWLIARKRDIEKIAVFGGKPFEMGLARAAMTIAGMASMAHFGNRLAEARAFLQWPEERYPG
jgi:hypothetical protein